MHACEAKLGFPVTVADAEVVAEPLLVFFVLASLFSVLIARQHAGNNHLTAKS
jgi:hypothetical protein